jgi:hypothetical protein
MRDWGSVKSPTSVITGQEERNTGEKKETARASERVHVYVHIARARRRRRMRAHCACKSAFQPSLQTLDPKPGRMDRQLTGLFPCKTLNLNLPA